MDPSLVFELVSHFGIHPRYVQHKRRCADQMHRIMCATHVGAIVEPRLSGLMEILEYVSYCLLIEYGFATPWYTRERIDIYYPLQIKALDLAFRREPRASNPNSLGGFRV